MYNSRVKLDSKEAEVSIITTENELREDVHEEVLECTLCIVGAGLAGLNALVCAAPYLGKNDKVIILDKKNGIGGMWPGAYDYIRLHQPHVEFTCGSIPWNLNRERSYLPTKTEILDYFKRCYEQVKNSVVLSEYWNYSLLDCQEVAVDGDYEVHASFASTTDQQTPRLLIKSQRLIKAFGVNVSPMSSLSFTSSSVQSITPSALSSFTSEIESSDKPVYIVGGGKTGMDTAFQVIKRFPGRTVHVFTGRGIAFLNRDQIYPTGPKRYFKGNLFTEVLLNTGLKFDGTNENETYDYFMGRYGISLSADPQNYVFGFLSEEEISVISNNVKTYNGYLEDVIDEDGSPVMKLRSGEKIPISEGSWFINCTGFLLKNNPPSEPYISKHGKIISIQYTSETFFFTRLSGYFLTNLWFLGKLKDLPLYQIDYVALSAKNQKVVSLTAMCHTLHNLIKAVDVLPLKLVLDCAGVVDKLHPIYKSLFFYLKVLKNKNKYLNHFQQTLDTVRERYDINCEILEN